MVYADSDRKFSDKDEFLRYIIDRYYEEIMTYILKSVRDYADSEDITQETFMSFYNSVDRFRYESSIRTYIYRIAISRIINHENKKKRENNKILNYLSWIADRKDKKDSLMTDNIRGNELNDILRKAIAGFPARQKAILSLRLFKGFKIKEIAELLEVSEGNIKSQISSGLKKLQNVLKENGYGL